MRGFAGIAILLCSLVAVAAEESFPGIERLMSDAEFEAAGLRELGPAQRAALDAWLERYSRALQRGTPPSPAVAATSAATGAPAPPAPAARVTPAPAEPGAEPARRQRAAPIVSRIVGDFRGWSGDTVFELENGQIWRQRIAQKRYAYRGPPNPEVRIERNWLGFYMMHLVEADESVGVSRVR